ncbi:MAG TPA: RNA methyltransferase [Candidatus Angelobacter sp.]|nr:RNA methyltransferase [Candidatus Angelobacter sp.]
MTVENETAARLRPVTSRQNALVKELRKAFAHGEPTSDGSLAIEGVRQIEEAVRSGLRFQAIIFSESGRTHAARLLPQISSHAETLLLPDDVFTSAVSTETPQGVAALVKLKPVTLQQLMEQISEDTLLVGVAGLQDPGNLGTVIRSAEAFGARGILIGEKTVSYFNPKVARASAGSLFREPLVRVNMMESIQQLKNLGVRVLATSSHKGTPLPQVDFRRACMVVIGNEGAGVAPEILSAADELITIPQSPRVESLNAGIAASIILYEAARQKNLTADER